MVTAILIVGVWLWLQTVSEVWKFWIYLIFQTERSFRLFSKAQHYSSKSLLKIFFSGKRWAKYYWIWESFLKIGWGVIGKTLFYNPRLAWEAVGLQGLWRNMIGRGERQRADGGFFSLDGCGARGLEHKDSAWFFCWLVYFFTLEVMSAGEPSCNIASPFLSAFLYHLLWWLQPKQLCGNLYTHQVV